jgi:hypothetical protein
MGEYLKKYEIIDMLIFVKSKTNNLAANEELWWLELKHIRLSKNNLVFVLAL